MYLSDEDSHQFHPHCSGAPRRNPLTTVLCECGETADCGCGSCDQHCECYQTNPVKKLTRAEYFALYRLYYNKSFAKKILRGEYGAEERDKHADLYHELQKRNLVWGFELSDPWASSFGLQISVDGRKAVEAYQAELQAAKAEELAEEKYQTNPHRTLFPVLPHQRGTHECFFQSLCCWCQQHMDESDGEVLTNGPGRLIHLICDWCSLKRPDADETRRWITTVDPDETRDWDEADIYDRPYQVNPACDEKSACDIYFAPDRNPRASQAEVIGKTLAQALFRDMSDKANQGSAFSWDKFPEMAASRARIELYLYLTRSPSSTEKEQAADAARREATKLRDNRPKRHY